MAIFYAGTSKCPNCRATILRAKKDILITNIINDLKVSCNYPKCPWKSILSNLDDHMQSCGFKKEAISKNLEEDRNFININEVNVEEHLTCNICLDIFKDPHRIDCR